MKRLLKFILIIGLLVSSSVFAKPNLRFVFTGVQDDIVKNISNRLGLDANNEIETADIQKTYRDAATEIPKAVEPYGYFHSTFRSQLQQTNSIWIATYKIRLGPPVKIASVIIDVKGAGKNNKKIKKYLHNLPIHQGDIFTADSYQAMKDKLLLVATNQGFIKAAYTDSKVLINPEAKQVTIILSLDTGERFYFGKVTYNANPYSPELMKRFITFHEGEYFSSEKMIALQQKLAGSYYFTNVVATPDFANAQNNQVPINLTVKPPKSQRYNIGIGYGSFTGVRLTAGVNFRRLTNTGQHLDAQLQYSKVLYGLTAKYLIPGIDPLNDQWYLGVNAQKFMPQTGTSSTSETLSVGYTTNVGKLTSNTSLNYLIENYKIEGEHSQHSNVLYPNLNLVYTKTNDLVNPSKGYSATLNLQGGSQALGSSTSFLQGEISGKYLFSPMDFNKVILRADIGYTIVHDLDQLPLTMRFNTGGVSSIRGYDDYSIGPGRYMQVGSIEYRNKISGNLSGALFYDIGQASNHWSSKMYQGTGVGLVYDSMIGPIKVYVAQPLITDEDHKNTFGFYFTIGPEF